MKLKLWFGSESSYTRPSFLSGAARILDLGGTFDRRQSSANDEDFRALQGDWAVVGEDMRAAIEAVTGKG
jgi:hypothetical protein